MSNVNISTFADACHAINIFANEELHILTAKLDSKGHMILVLGASMDKYYLKQIISNMKSFGVDKIPDWPSDISIIACVVPSDANHLEVVLASTRVSSEKRFFGSDVTDTMSSFMRSRTENLTDARKRVFVEKLLIGCANFSVGKITPALGLLSVKKKEMFHGEVADTASSISYEIDFESHYLEIREKISQITYRLEKCFSDLSSSGFAEFSELKVLVHPDVEMFRPEHLEENMVRVTAQLFVVNKAPIEVLDKELICIRYHEKWNTGSKNKSRPIFKPSALMTKTSHKVVSAVPGYLIDYLDKNKLHLQNFEVSENVDAPTVITVCPVYSDEYEYTEASLIAANLSRFLQVESKHIHNWLKTTGLTPTSIRCRPSDHVLYSRPFLIKVNMDEMFCKNNI